MTQWVVGRRTTTMLFALIFAQISTAQPAVQSLVAKARLARYQQDSSLAEYRAIAKQRMSAGIGLSTVFGVGIPGPEKLAARFESVARVGWHERYGPFGEVIAARGVAPIVGDTKPDPADDVSLVLPYYPGSDALWPMDELRGAFHDHRDWITHPLDTGSDSLYEFSLGDSATIRLPSGSALNLREIIVRPRRPSERLIVGSLWVDVTSGNLVRAAYRPSTPVDLWPLMTAEMENDDEGKRALKSFGPYNGNVREVIIEHGLYEGRFWLPRIRTASGEGTARGARVSISIEQTFTYEKVRAMPEGQKAGALRQPADTALNGRVRYTEWNGRVRTGPCRAVNDSSPQWSPDSLATSSRLPMMNSQGVRFRTLVPCTAEQMVNSSALPGSIYGNGEALFTETDFDKLRSDATKALSMDRQAKWSPQPPTVTYGWNRGLLRYNRVEGLSAGAMVEQTLGNGYTATYTARFGFADLQPNGEATLARTNIRSEIRGTAYRRLAAANEWDDPFAIGPSAIALVFGRDDGLYYRTMGAEIGGYFRRTPQSAVWSWRVFGEREDSATVQTNRSFPNLIHGGEFAPNIQAMTGNFGGASLVGLKSWGSDPRGARLSSMIKGEALTSESTFGRGSLEFTLARGFGRSTEATLTGSSGYSFGDLPTQRLWYLGGPHTVRGFAPGAMIGDAFWFGRFELATGHPVFRPAIFGDLGWAGSREAFQHPGTPISGIGAGLTFIDGILRFDVARASTGKTRIDLYFNPR